MTCPAAIGPSRRYFATADTVADIEALRSVRGTGLRLRSRGRSGNSGPPVPRRAPAPPALTAPRAGLPPVPVLLLAGGRDLSTPLAGARAEAALAPWPPARRASGGPLGPEPGGRQSGAGAGRAVPGRRLRQRAAAGCTGVSVSPAGCSQPRSQQSASVGFSLPAGNFFF